ARAAVGHGDVGAHALFCYDAPDNQTWNFHTAGDSGAVGGFFADGYYTIRAQHSGKCPEVENASQADAATVHQMSCDPATVNTSQQWRLLQRPNGFFSLVARHSGKCLTVLDGALADKTAIVQQACDNDLPYQEWKLI
ncbi:RICIN domain-containing protein, partial [Streptomyces sp. TRM76130]|nr:RICIN domain-containing protein [Streptomyces sp. TRM76130]